MMKLLPSWKELEPGCVVTTPGSSVNYKTGDWRSFYPKTDEDKCIACGLCWIYCPDNSRRKAPRKNKKAGALYDVYFDFDYYFCKGCGICAAECPTKAIVMVEGGMKK